MSHATRGWTGIRESVSYRLLYILVLSFGGVGVFVFGEAAYVNWGWTPDGSAGASAWFGLAVLLFAAYLGFLLLLPPRRSPFTRR